LHVDPQTSVRRGAERDQDWAGSAAEAVHRDRYLVAERLYIDEVDPIRFVDVVIDNRVFDRPRIVLER
jgi:uridine kinase